MQQIGIDIEANLIPANSTQAAQPEFHPGFVIGLTYCIGHFENDSILKSITLNLGTSRANQRHLHIDMAAEVSELASK